MAEIEIVEIKNNAPGRDTQTNLNGEYIAIKNKTQDSKFRLVGYIVSDTTPTGQDTHLFRFPETVNGKTWTLDPGEYIFLFTGQGLDIFRPAEGSYPPQFHFHMQRKAFVWNNPGDTAYLRLPSGQFIHWMQVP